MMRAASERLWVGLITSTIALVACQTPATNTKSTPPPTDQRSPASAPVLQSVTMRMDVPVGNGIVMSVVPDFHFIAPNGNAIVLHRELVDTNGAIAQTQIASETINIPAEAQKRGAVLSGGWRCGVAQYYVTLRAYVMDADGNRSNSIEYTIHCNGG
jgi:hypothetical protein